MLRERKKTHRVPELNTTSTADISFMLLTFFLVTTSMETDRGITQQLPPMPQEKEQSVAEVKRRNVLLVALDGADRITCNGKEVSADGLKAKVMEFVDNESDSKDLPEKVWRDIPLLGRCAVTANHQIFIKADRETQLPATRDVQDKDIPVCQVLEQNGKHIGYMLYNTFSPDNADEVKQYAQQFKDSNVSDVVLDLRYNAGGDSSVINPLVDALERIQDERGLEVYVLIGEDSFSSAILNALTLRERLGAVLVGRPTGGSVSHFGELDSFVLPDTGLTCWYSTKWFDNGEKGPLLPDIYTPRHIEDYRTGRDGALVQLGVVQ